jgi:hypothetical protein
MNIINKIGPKINAYGNLRVIRFCDGSFPLALILWCLFIKKTSIRFITFL